MRAYVFTDRKLERLAGRFVRLDIDTEKPGNAAFVERFPIDAWPTLLVLDPVTEKVVVRWAGTATAEQILSLADDGAHAIRARQASEADAALARADALLGERRHADAADGYRAALAAGGPRWTGRERAVEALVQATALGGDSRACASAAIDALPALPPGASLARISAQGLACALDLDEGPPRRAAIAKLEPAARRALGFPGVLADDRSWLFDVLSSARAAAGDDAGSKAVARRWLAFLDGEAARATTPLARSAYDAQRLQAATRLGDPARVLPALLASERALPGDFVPPTNLASLYLRLDRPKDALAAADRALAHAEGPRRVRVLVLRARAERALGDAAAARETIARAIREGEAFPEALRPRSALGEARRVRQELEGAGDG
ncbi:SPFH domain-containing protein [Anaeromyxobacter oryzae]|uniref:Uncharacterized protein n=1 Tax=Anaeromyxobacter oryzae TaxID=2918170 RepID=A0ABM7WWV6_9BACT|nr:hypothetical protein [Anaeromyxobacter oryzae]BDG03997.1 hypothetical protein AMOR_29930 [Anaeromyxobacter oryzae]